MSADLLRRAAAKLREHAEAATPGPWFAFTQTSDGQNFVGTAGSGADKHVTVEVEAHDGWHSIDLKRQQADAEFIALMHPPLDLALADWLEGAADDFEVGRVLGGFQPRSMAGAMATARAVLREPEEAK